MEHRTTHAASSTDAQLQTLWRDLNGRYFSGALPPIRIEWSRRLTASAGMFVCRCGPRHALSRPMDGADKRPRIKLSSVLLHDQLPDLPRELRATLAHEMIHQWQFDVLKRRPNHGADFRRMMRRMNEDHLNITVYHALSPPPTSPTLYIWCCRQCGLIYRRHRRTIHPRRHRCGVCHGTLEELSVAPDRPPTPTVASAPAPETTPQLALPY